MKIITVHLNNLEGFKKTLHSINQFSKRTDRFQWLIKDGESQIEVIGQVNHSINTLTNAKFIIQKDSGVYDAMNQTLELIDDHDYVLFLNAGDQLSTQFVNMYKFEHFKGADIVFADMLYGEDEKKIEAPDQIDFAYLLRKTINHQSLIIKGKWVKKYPFKTEYNIVADWVQLFEILKNENIIIKKLGYPICAYEGGGISEIQEDKRKTERINYLRSIYSDWELDGLLVLSRLRQRKWYDFLLKSLDSPIRGMILAVFSKWMK